MQSHIPALPILTLRIEFKWLLKVYQIRFIWESVNSVWEGLHLVLGVAWKIMYPFKSGMIFQFSCREATQGFASLINLIF